MDGGDLLANIILAVDLDFSNSPDSSLDRSRDRSKYIPYIWSKESLDIPNGWDDFSYETTSKVMDFKDALPDLELPTKFKNKDWHVVKITGNLFQTADQYIRANPTSCKSFREELSAYYNTLSTEDLSSALSSKNMSGLLLVEARSVLKQKGIEYSDKEIVQMKTALVEQLTSSEKRAFGFADVLLALVFVIIISVVVMKILG